MKEDFTQRSICIIATKAKDTIFEMRIIYQFDKLYRYQNLNRCVFDQLISSSTENVNFYLFEK